MKTFFRFCALTALLLAGLVLATLPASASQAYGTISNFDVVNDTGHVCHGFEIELEDCHSTDITYTYDWNHYGKCAITEDNSTPPHPRTLIRWASARNPDGTWAAMTIIPTTPIAPTNGHMFTNPAVNFGGEHFGVGFRAPPSAARYYWLHDNGSGVLTRGPEVQVATPTFTYYPAAAGAPANVVAVIAPVPEPAPVKEFGEPVWVKEIRTTTHNNNEIKLRDLQSDDPDEPPAKDWRNNEPDEVEIEWQLLQEEFNKANGGANGELAGAPEDLDNGDEVVTRRYEFYAYTGPFDNESYQAMADAVAADGEHGVGTKLINGVDVDLTSLVIVGEYLGAQMAAFDQDAKLDLIEHVSDGRINTAYAARQVVISGSGPFICARTGDLPPGMSFNTTTGILSGTPTGSGTFQFSVQVTDDVVAGPVKKNYTLVIAAAGAELPQQFSVDTLASPLVGGTTTGDGVYAPDANITVTATPAAGYEFLAWMDNDVPVSMNASYTFTTPLNRSLVASFIPIQREISLSASPVAGGTLTGDGFYDQGGNVTVTATANAGYAFANWTESGTVVSSAASYAFTATANRALVANFTVVGTSRTIGTSSSPAVGGITSGAGTYADGSNVTVSATVNVGYTFANWTQGGAVVSSSAAYSFVANASRTLVANFTAIGGGGNPRSIVASVSPANSGNITGAGSYADGTSVTLTANNAAGYKFSHWIEDGTQASAMKSYTFTVAADRILVAVYVPALSIAVSANPPQGGLVEADAPDYEVGDGADVQADANPGYSFLNWTEDGTVVSTDWKYAFTITTSRTLVANFQSQGSATITLSASPAAGGTVTGGGNFAIGASVTALAQEVAGYKFTHWSEGGVGVSTADDYQFNAGANRTLVANFTAIPATDMKESEEDSDEMEFEWPDNAVGWVLQESTDLVNWVNSNRPVTQSGGKKKVKINKHSVPGVFFRLFKP